MAWEKLEDNFKKARDDVDDLQAHISWLEENSAGIDRKRELLNMIEQLIEMRERLDELYAEEKHK